MSSEEKTLTNNIEILLKKLEKTPSNEELRKLVIHMNSIAKDIKTIVDNRFDVKTDFDQFALKIHWKYGLRMYTPESRTEIAYIDNDCIEQKGFYKCLMEKFSDKTPMLNILLKVLAETLDSYMQLVTEIVTGSDEDNDP
ncbi:MAG: hypothetical protein QXW45_06815 [Thermosphaera sp.]